MSSLDSITKIFTKKYRKYEMRMCRQYLSQYNLTCMITECMAQDNHLSDWLVIQHYIMTTFFLVPEVTLKTITREKRPNYRKLSKAEVKK